MAQSFLGNLLINIILPVVIMTRGSEYLGALLALLIALAFPLCYGIWDWHQERKLNLYSGLGIASVLLTGVVGIFALSAQVLAIKEAGIPLLVGVVFALSSFTKKDATTAVLAQILDIDRLHMAYENKGVVSGFSQPLLWARLAFIGSFLFSAIANYFLTIVIVTAPAGSVEFTEQVGQMTGLAFPIIALPVMLVLLGAVYFLFWHVEKVTKKKHSSFLSKKMRDLSS